MIGSACRHGLCIYIRAGESGLERNAIIHRIDDILDITGRSAGRRHQQRLLLREQQPSILPQRRRKLPKTSVRGSREPFQIDRRQRSRVPRGALLAFRERFVGLKHAPEELRRRVDRRVAARVQDERKVVPRRRVLEVPARRPLLHEAVVPIHARRRLESVGEIYLLPPLDYDAIASVPLFADRDQSDPVLREAQFCIPLAIVVVQEVVDRYHTHVARAGCERHEGTHGGGIAEVAPAAVLEPSHVSRRFVNRKQALQLRKRRRSPIRREARQLDVI
mmetsp:Transcript_52706/g.111987  ORF Transcript_52706/g.111987 Transcript_52706/m.111987 type:complete len:277 (-) Transcript_52706:520-1350(-)